MRRFVHGLVLAGFVASNIVIMPLPVLANTQATRSLGELSMIEDWKVGPVDTENGPSCAMIGRFEENSVLALADNNNGKPSVVLAFAEDAFEIGKTYPVTLRPSSGKTLRVEGKAANPNSLVIDLSENKDFLQTLSSKAKILKIETPVSKTSFALDTLGKAFAQNKECMAQMNNPQQQTVVAANVDKVESADLPSAPVQTASNDIVWSPEQKAAELNRQLYAEQERTKVIAQAKKEAEKILLGSIDEDKSAAAVVSSIAPGAGMSDAQVAALNAERAEKAQLKFKQFDKKQQSLEKDTARLRQERDRIANTNVAAGSEKEIRAGLVAKQSQLASKQASADSNKQKLTADLATVHESYRTRIAELEAERDGLRQRSILAEGQNKKLSLRLKESEDSLAAKVNQIEPAAGGKTASAYDQKIAAQYALLSEKLIGMQANITSLEQKLKNAEAEKIAVKQSETKLASALAEKDAALAKVQAQLDEVSQRANELAAAAAEQKNLGANSFANAKELNETQQLLSNIRTERDALRDQNEKLRAQVSSLKQIAQKPVVMSMNTVTQEFKVVQKNPSAAEEFVMPIESVQKESQKIEPASGIVATTGLKAPKSNNKAADFLDRVMSYHVKSHGKPNQKPQPMLAEVKTPVKKPALKQPQFARPVVSKTAETAPVLSVVPQVQQEDLPPIARAEDIVPTLRDEPVAQLEMQSAPVVSEPAAIAAAPVLETPADTRQAMMLLPDVLAKAGVAAVSFMPPEDTEQKWQSGAITGLFETAEAKSELKSQAKNYMQRYQQDCPKQLELKLRDASGGSIIADASCKMPGNSYMTSFVFAPKGQKVLIFGHSGLPAQSAQIKSISDNIAYALISAGSVSLPQQNQQAKVEPAAGIQEPLQQNKVSSYAPQPKFRFGVFDKNTKAASPERPAVEVFNLDDASSTVVIE